MLRFSLDMKFSSFEDLSTVQCYILGRYILGRKGKKNYILGRFFAFAIYRTVAKL